MSQVLDTIKRLIHGHSHVVAPEEAQLMESTALGPPRTASAVFKQAKE